MTYALQRRPRVRHDEDAFGSFVANSLSTEGRGYLPGPRAVERPDFVVVTPYGQRTRRLPAPQHVVWDDLAHPATTGSRAWLDLLDDEVRPRVIESDALTRVLWSSLWPSRPEDQVVLDLAHVGAETALTFTLLAVGDPPDGSRTGHIRRRINHLLYADLRFSYGQ